MTVILFINYYSKIPINFNQNVCPNHFRLCELKIILKCLVKWKHFALYLFVMQGSSPPENGSWLSTRGDKLLFKPNYFVLPGELFLSVKLFKDAECNQIGWETTNDYCTVSRGVDNLTPKNSTTYDMDINAPLTN